MIIVNQNKTVIMNFNNTNYIAISDDEPLIFARTNNNSEITLGRYETKERAKEVLQEIIDSYSDSIDYMHNQTLLIGELEEYRESLVYRMPKE